MRQSTRGFTLIEMSVVLVIIGLIVGGILVGQNLIRAAQVRGAISELDKIKVAVTTFRTKYDCLPGDCGNITMFFPQDTSCPNTTGSASATTTCNGNGNGSIDSQTEADFFFQHLSLAGMIDENIGLPVANEVARFTTGNNNGSPDYQNSYLSRFYGVSNGNVNVPSAFKTGGILCSMALVAGTRFWGASCLEILQAAHTCWAEMEATPSIMYQLCPRRMLTPLIRR